MKSAKIEEISDFEPKTQKTAKKRAQKGTLWHTLAQIGTLWHTLAQKGTDWHKKAQLLPVKGGLIVDSYTLIFSASALAFGRVQPRKKVVRFCP
jgi:hypothetical protein